MSDANPTPVIPKWLSSTIITLLAMQVGLLWTHGSLLQRQHDDLQALREDVQSLAESLDQNQDGWDSGEDDPNPHPARATHPHPGGRPVRVAFRSTEQSGAEQADAEDPALAGAKQDQDATRKSEAEAIAKARDIRSKLSIEENIRKADEKAKLEAETDRWKPWLWLGTAVALLALLGRSWMRRRG